jgi:hypothetical protein
LIRSLNFCCLGYGIGDVWERDGVVDLPSFLLLLLLCGFDTQVFTVMDETTAYVRLVVVVMMTTEERVAKIRDCMSLRVAANTYRDGIYPVDNSICAAV